MTEKNYNSAGAWAKKFHLASRSAMEATLRPYDLGSTQWYVMWHLVHDGAMAQRDLQSLLQVEKATLSGVVSALVRKKLVEQTASETDQRQKRISITTLGRKLWDSLPDPIERLRETAFAGISEDDLATVVRVLSTGTKRLDNILQKGK